MTTALLTIVIILMFGNIIMTAFLLSMLDIVLKRIERWVLDLRDDSKEKKNGTKVR